MTSRVDVEDFSVDRATLFAALAQIEEALVVLREDGVIVFASPACQTLTGWDPVDLIGRNVVDFLDPEDATEALMALGRLEGREGAMVGDAMRVRAADGRRVLLHYSAIAGETVRPLGAAVLTLRDVSDAEPDRLAVLHNRANETRLVQLASTFLGLSVDDFDSGVAAALSVVAGLTLVTRVSVFQAVGERAVRRGLWEANFSAPTTSIARTLPVSAIPRLVELHEVHYVGPEEILAGWPVAAGEALVAGGVQEILAVPMSRNGEFRGFIVLEHTYPGQSFDATHFSTARSAAAMFAEAFARNEVERELLRSARTDALTALPNRWTFERALDSALEAVAAGESAGAAIALIDLDRFKIVNDGLGHHTGDHLLAEVADRLSSAARNQGGDGAIVARLGGDEFLLLVDQCATAEEADERVRKVLTALEPPFDASGQPVLLTASVGVVHVTDGSSSPLELLRRADVAMFRAKTLGGNRLVPDDETSRHRVVERLKVEHDLREAIHDGAIRPFMQGEWDLLSGRLVGAEALARWEHPVNGVMPASEFISIAEESDLVIALGDHVLGEATAALAAWRWRGFDGSFVLRVNLSARQLHEGGLLAKVTRVLDESGLDPADLCLELTESALLVDPPQAIRTLTAVRDLGCGLAIDDFGTGYSSMLYLRSLPLTCIKIDRAFVSGLLDTTADRAIVASIVQLAENLGVTVTAEGVETEAQREALLDMGCRHAQGYHLSRPEPIEQFANRLIISG